MSIFTLALGIISILWLAYDYILYSRLQPVTKEMGELGRFEKLAEFVWLSYIYLFFFHILAAGTLVIQMRFIQRIQAMSILAIAIGVFSFLGVFSDWAVFGDIGKEYEMGWDTSGEWTILYVILGIQLVFTFLVTAISAGVLRFIGQSNEEVELSAKDEIVFVVAQYVGIICGLIGIAWVGLGLTAGKNTGYTVYHTIASTIMILFPYCLIVCYWFILRFNDKIGEWYDEKQWRDVTKAGFWTMLLLIPTLLFFFIAFSLSGENYSTKFLWFPFTLYVILFFFSLLTLLNYRRA
ncbi:hypothetical protein ACFLSP_00310 [Bacteroidota bacterium]